MINYSKTAKDSYIAQITKLQKELGKVPTNIISYTDLHWLHNALNDLRKIAENEWKNK